LHGERQAIQDVPAIYFVSPTKENVQRIARDCAAKLYDSFYLNFSSSIPRPLLEELAESTLEAGVSSRIAKALGHPPPHNAVRWPNACGVCVCVCGTHRCMINMSISWRSRTGSSLLSRSDPTWPLTARLSPMLRRKPTSNPLPSPSTRSWSLLCALWHHPALSSFIHSPAARSPLPLISFSLR